MIIRKYQFVILLIIGADKDKPDWKCVKDFLLKEGPLLKD
jgi:hypothetical protein